MNTAFKAAASQYKQIPAAKSHSQQVARLYRKSLKLLNAWIIDRNLFNQEATLLREEFNKHASLAADSAKTSYLMEQAQEKLVTYAHPDKYIVPWMPGGSLFMRNPALPLEVCYPEGFPEGVHKKEYINIDMSPVVEGEKPIVLVDSATKSFAFEN
ncbi:unnamed protein product [Heterosigma akashiwo]|mmetsp:Transcript_22389/g.30958  ORF Transcript_22389/g.30958 Transcript_22389/m.30958 type:complete len:156 (-) Transcript_22389:681-1148(-)|eukprot:CAMPEP_0194573248 /NCGR_PEP_ID=MMETSP0292-20121207/9524_1 /TAXON_ID=39354 /ORGANISM="Heterosigma akashiwo, Strain CCMP2393" /LENGTH=155 /DNA_ID=CAMNT_0039424429 /DNA_START=45 /DNA_END=512 /DNA_ORIENTATION=-